MTVVRITMHGKSRRNATKKAKHGTTHHGKVGMHGDQLPTAARKDAWKHKGQAKGQG
jgi:hypothetical protein